MNKIIINYILKNFIKTFLIIVSVFYCFGIILNLFEEIEFFKNIEVNILTPLLLTCIFIPSVLIKILPFIIFISSMWFMVKLRNSRDLLALKIYGFSNLKIFMILALTSFILGWIILILVNPITSSMSKYYEQTKSSFSRDIDHLVTFNKNGLWIKENLSNKQRIISAEKPEGFDLINVTIFHLNEDSSLIEKIISKKVNIKNKKWLLEDVEIFRPSNGILIGKKYNSYRIDSIYDYEKITSLFKNFDTMSFFDLSINFKKLLERGYNKQFLTESFHVMLSLPFFLCLMTGLASIITMNTLKRTENIKFIIIGLVISVIVFYFKDLSMALGQTNRIPLLLAIWAPIIALSLFTTVGMLQINEK